jgi:hypothetical protein
MVYSPRVVDLSPQLVLGFAMVGSIQAKYRHRFFYWMILDEFFFLEEPQISGQKSENHTNFHILPEASSPSLHSSAVRRGNAWLRQFEQVEMANTLRAELAEELENCPPELKRMVQPMLPPGKSWACLVIIFGSVSEWEIH